MVAGQHALPEIGISENILAIDIGGSNIKACILDTNGNKIHPYEKIVTPEPATPDAVVEAIQELVLHFPAYAKVSVGFPGYVRDGKVYTAPNLAKGKWKCIDLAGLLNDVFKKPVKVVNDADMLGLGIAKGNGLEMVVTLGTGFGTALLYQGLLLPHLEIAHHPLTKKGDYDIYIGDRALEKIGIKKWNKRMEKVLDILKTVVNYDHLYIGGGNAGKLKIKLENNITLFSNRDGIHGGVYLWKTLHADS